ncbi:MAG: DsbA family protein [Stellaceae bacterium]|jgi:protein-disulfide isomerase
MRKIWLIAAALAWTALAFGPARAADVPQIQPDDRVLGKADAPIVIFEFFSLTCPHCAVFDQETLPLVKKNWIDTGKAKLVYRDFPLDQEALFAAVVARCLPPQRYPGFIDAVFANQRDWATSGDYKAALAKLAKIAGMSQHDFDACTGDQKMSDAVMAAEFDAKNRYEIESTPTFFVNGKKVVGDLAYPDFVKYLAGDPNAGATGVATAAADRRILDRVRQWFGALMSRS